MKLDDLRAHLRAQEVKQARPLGPKPKSAIKIAAEKLSTSARPYRSGTRYCDCCGRLPTTIRRGNWFCNECVSLMTKRMSAGANLCDLCLSSDVVHHSAGTRPFPLLCLTCQDLDWEEDHKP